ncbi:MAG TPA: FkbM family methyltransferase, partial [Candidatus Elarobacter sp.]
AMTVETVRLDDAIPDHRVDVIKIDVEGAEPVVLAGMPQILAKNPNLIVFAEFAPTHLERSATDPVEFAASLRERFTVRAVDDLSGALRPMDLTEITRRPSTNLMLTAR